MKKTHEMLIICLTISAVLGTTGSVNAAITITGTANHDGGGVYTMTTGETLIMDMGGTDTYTLTATGGFANDIVVTFDGLSTAATKISEIDFGSTGALDLATTLTLTSDQASVTDTLTVDSIVDTSDNVGTVSIAVTDNDVISALAIGTVALSDTGIATWESGAITGLSAETVSTSMVVGAVGATGITTTSFVGTLTVTGLLTGPVNSALTLGATTLEAGSAGDITVATGNIGAVTLGDAGDDGTLTFDGDIIATAGLITSISGTDETSITISGAVTAGTSVGAIGTHIQTLSGTVTAGTTVGAVTVLTDLSGALVAGTTVGAVTVGNDLTGDVTVGSGNISSIVVGGEINGSTIRAEDDITSIDVTGDLTATVTASYNDIDGTGDIGTVTSGGEITVTMAAINIGTVRSGGLTGEDINGTITATGDIDLIDAGDAIIEATVTAGAATSLSPLATFISGGYSYAVWAFETGTTTEDTGITAQIVFDGTGSPDTMTISKLADSTPATTPDIYITTRVDTGVEQVFADPDVSLIDAPLYVSIDAYSPINVGTLYVEAHCTIIGSNIMADTIFCEGDVVPPVNNLLILGGEFLMGDHFDEGRADELPVHLVYVDSFYMSKYETTNQQYCDYLNDAISAGQIKVVSDVVYALTDSGNNYPYCDTNASSSYSFITWNGNSFDVLTGKESHPMLMVSWYGAIAYCNYYGYRLPTEAEWEYAARGGEYSPYYRYPWGDSIDGSMANYSTSSGDPYDSELVGTTPVGYYNGNQIPAGSDMANGYGLYDMAGNAWEWCNDWYSDTYYQECDDIGIVYNPQGPVSGTERVFRSGSWHSLAVHSQIANRYPNIPGFRNFTVGFRVVQDYGLPDLEVTSEDITFDPFPGVPESPSTIEATIRNQGSASAQNVEVVFKDFDSPIGAPQIIGSLLPDQSQTVSIQHTWDDPNFHLITVETDPTNIISEQDETNNSASKIYQVGDISQMDAGIELSVSAPTGFAEGTTGSISGTASYRIQINDYPDYVYPVKGGSVTAEVFYPTGVTSPTQTLSIVTGPDGGFSFSFGVPGNAGEEFDVKIAVSDGSTLDPGTWQRTFLVGGINDLWVSDITFSNENPDPNETINIGATVHASPDNIETVENVPVMFYTQLSSQCESTQMQLIGQISVSEMSPGASEPVSINWTPDVEGLYYIRVVLGYSDDNYSNNRVTRTIRVGPEPMLTVTANPRYDVHIGQVVEITVDAGEQLLNDELNSIIVTDSAEQSINVTLENHVDGSTQWVYQTDLLPDGTAYGTAIITVTGTDINSIEHTADGCFEVIEGKSDLWLYSNDITFSNDDPNLGETITIDAEIHAGDNTNSVYNVPVTFSAQHASGDSYQIGLTQNIAEIGPGENWSASTTWTNAAEGGYVIEVILGPGYSDDRNYNNRATEAIIVGDHPFLTGSFNVLYKIREDRTVFRYVCQMTLDNISHIAVENVQLELVDVSNNMTIIDPNVAFAFVDAFDWAIGEDTCSFEVDRSSPIDPASVRWQATYKRTDTGETVRQASVSMVFLEPYYLAYGDFNGDNRIDVNDLVILSRTWLQIHSIADIAPPPYGDGIVNILDFAVLAEHWLEEVN